MKKKNLIILLGLTAAVAVSGCGNKKETPETSAPVSVEEEPATEFSATAESLTPEEGLTPITPSDYLVENPSQYVTLGSLDHLTASQTAVDVTDEMVQEQIENELYMYSEEKEVEKAAEGNIVYADVTSTIQGEEGSSSTESTYFTIGDADYGEEFDKQLIGAAVNNELSFSVSYDDDTWFEEWVDKTVDFKVKVTGVYEVVIPEYDDTFISEYTDYSSRDEYEDSIRESLLSEGEQNSYSETVNSLFQSVIGLSTFNGYPDELYTSCEDEIISYYGQFIGEEDVDAILNALDLTREDLKEDVLYTVNYRLIISALCEEQNIDVTEEEYVSEVTDAAQNYGFSPTEYESEVGRESIVWSLYENKAAEYLYNLADITLVTDSETEAPEEETFDMYEEISSMEEETSDTEEPETL